MIRSSNEIAFVMAFNNKKIDELNPLLMDLVLYLFKRENISYDSVIKSWKNHFKQKTDVFIKIDGICKRISIKMGSRNSVHVENIESFVNFLEEENVSKHAISGFLKFHYGDGTCNNSGINRVSAEEYKKNKKSEIEYVNDCFSNKQLVLKMVNRFVLRGLVYSDHVDVIVSGTPDDFVWISERDIKRVILLNRFKYCSSPHFSSLVCQPLNRCINHNPKYEYGRNYVQIKWYSLFDDIIMNMYLNYYGLENLPN